MIAPRTEIALIQWECQQLLNRVTLLTDNADWQVLVQCYTEDALLARPSDPNNPICNIAEPDRVIAATDCGFGTFAGYGKIDPGATWKKLAALRQGADLVASRW